MKDFSPTHEILLPNATKPIPVQAAKYTRGLKLYREGQVIGTEPDWMIFTDGTLMYRAQHVTADSLHVFYRWEVTDATARSILAD